MRVYALAPSPPLPPSTRLRVHVHAGDRVRLPCAIVGQPPPSVLWRRHARIVDNRGRFSTLVDEADALQIMPVIVDDQGEYTCLTANAHGTAVVQVDLKVYGESLCVMCDQFIKTGRQMALAIEPGDTKLQANHVLVLRCVSDECHVNGKGAT